MKFKFEGGKELDSALSELGKRSTARRVADRALRKAAEPVRDRWKELVDVDQGDLRRSIKIGKAIKSVNKIGNVGKTVTTFIGVDESEDRRLHIYAEIEEFGADHHLANPAGRNAWDQEKQTSLNMISSELKTEIEKTAARAARKTARLAAKG